MDTTKRKIIEWAMAQDDDLKLFIHHPDYEPDEDWTGARDGDLAILAQSDTFPSIYGEETDDIEQADLLVGSVGGRWGDYRDNVRETVESLLNAVFGDEADKWHDSYAQCRGWFI